LTKQKIIEEFSVVTIWKSFQECMSIVFLCLSGHLVGDLAQELPVLQKESKTKTIVILIRLLTKLMVSRPKSERDENRCVLTGTTDDCHMVAQLIPPSLLNEKKNPE
jgi:hypothetical protein